MKIRSTITGAALCVVSLGIGASLGHHSVTSSNAMNSLPTHILPSSFAQPHALQSDVRLLSAPESQPEQNPAAPQRWIF